MPFLLEVAVAAPVVVTLAEAPEVAAVGEDGTLTAKSVGQTAVTVSCPALDYEQVLLVKVWDYATGLKTETALLLQPGDTAPLNTPTTYTPMTIASASFVRHV